MPLEFISSSPARVCLYGEHQDYLGLKVIPSAITLRLQITAELSRKSHISVYSSIQQQSIYLSPSISSVSKNLFSFQSYLEAGIIALQRQFPHFTLPNFNATIDSAIPPESGLSSSAALLVGWINLLAKISFITLKPKEIAELAYVAEHDILGIPCGRMDQYSCALGKVISLDCTEPPVINTLSVPNCKFIVVFSNIPKHTSNIHSKKVDELKSVANKLETIAQLPLTHIDIEDFQHLSLSLSLDEQRVAQAILSIKKDTEQAEVELKKNNPSLTYLGKLLTSQQYALREGIGVSLPLLDKIVQTGINNGALGGKITGAGLGGSVVLLTDGNEKQISQAIADTLNLPNWIVSSDEGVK